MGSLVCPRLVGRDDPLAVVQGCLAGERDERVVVLAGEPGIGTSRLLGAVVDGVADTVAVVEGRCEDSPPTSPAPVRPSG